MQICRRIALIMGSSVLLSANAWALRVSPMSGEWNLSATAHYELTVVNDANKVTPIKVTAMARGQNAAGEDVLLDTADLSVFPRQVLLKASEARVIRVSLKNKAVPKVERPYRLIVEEIPTKDDSVKGSGMHFVSRFMTAMYLLPEHPRSIVSLVSATRVADGFTMTLRNEGDTHSLFSKPIFKIFQGDVTQTLDFADDLKPIPFTNLFPATQRTVTWHWPATAPRPMIDLSRAYRVEMSWECPHCKKDRPVLDIKVD